MSSLEQRRSVDIAGICVLADEVQRGSLHVRDGLLGAVCMGGILIGTLQSEIIHRPGYPQLYDLGTQAWINVCNSDSGQAVLRATKVPTIALGNAIFGDYNVAAQRSRLPNRQSIIPSGKPRPHYGYRPDSEAIDGVKLHAIDGYIKAVDDNHPDLYGVVDVVAAWRFHINPEAPKWDDQWLTATACHTLATFPATVADLPAVRSIDYSTYDVSSLPNEQSPSRPKN